MKGHTANMKEELNYALKEAKYAKLSQKEENYQLLDLKEQMDKKTKNSNPEETRLFEYAEAERIK